MDNRDINNLLNEIINSDSIAIQLLRDTVIDYRKICQRLIIVFSISVLLNLISILYCIFSIV